MIIPLPWISDKRLLFPKLTLLRVHCYQLESAHRYFSNCETMIDFYKYIGCRRYQRSSSRYYILYPYDMISWSSRHHDSPSRNTVVSLFLIDLTSNLGPVRWLQEALAFVSFILRIVETIYCDVTFTFAEIAFHLFEHSLSRCSERFIVIIFSLSLSLPHMQ